MDFWILQVYYPRILDLMTQAPMQAKNSVVTDNGVRKPLYVKIGKRIRQARLMAGETNSRDLSIRLGWSGGRLHNYETGVSTPGVDGTLQFCDAVKVDPGWITYGTGAPRSAEIHSARYRNFIDALDDAEKKGCLEEYLLAIKLPLERMQKFRNKPYTRIPDVMARRCEKYFGHHRGWIDESHGDGEFRPYLAEDLQELLVLYARMTPKEKKKFHAMGQLLLD
jgi:transcriptional regulator with XRE-family HTH domain